MDTVRRAYPGIPFDLTHDLLGKRQFIGDAKLAIWAAFQAVILFAHQRVQRIWIVKGLGICTRGAKLTHLS